MNTHDFVCLTWASIGTWILLMTTALALGVTADSAAVPLPSGDHGKTILFLDDKDLESRPGLDRRAVLPTRHADNPVIRPEFDWEEGSTPPITVLYDAEAGLWRMWYQIAKISGGKKSSSADGAVEPISVIYMGAYAESTDGLDYYRPILEMYEYRGSKRNSIVGGYEFMYPHVRLPEGHPWKYMRPCYPPGHPKHMFVEVSQDGFHWEKTTEEPILKEVCDTHALLDGGWDANINQYVGYFRPDWTSDMRPGRTIGRSTSPDAVRWSKLEKILVPDDADPLGTEFYQLRAYPYEGQYVGFLNVLHLDRELRDLDQEEPPTGKEQTMDVQLVTSRDGISWDRQNNREPVIPVGVDGTWDDRSVSAKGMVTTNDKIWVFYSASNCAHHLGDLFKLGTVDETGRRFDVCGGIVEYRLDGFVCLTPQFRDGTGTATTVPFVLEGDTVVLNVNARNGQVRVAVCDGEGKALPGLSLDDCVPIMRDSTRAMVRWQQSATLREYLGHEIRLRIQMQGRSELYAIRIS